MRHRGDLAARAIAALVALCAAACSAKAPQDIEYPSTNCRRVALIDQVGEKVRGAEDLAVDAARERLIVSGYDRRAVEKAAATGAVSVPEGGVYAVSFASLAPAATIGAEAAATPIVAAGAIPGGLRPHGLVYIPETDEIAFVNRAYRNVNGRSRLESGIERVSASDGSRLGAIPAHCAANDLIADEAGLLVTFDHGACDWRAALEDVFSLRRGGVGLAGGDALFTGVSYANGVIETAGGAIAVAATREKALLMLGGDGRLSVTSRIKLPGGPDNLTSGKKGTIVAAVHPSTLRLAAARKLGLGKAPSRVIRIDPAAGAVELLFDDPTGEIFSGATVAVERDGVLILGSAVDEGLIVCAAAGGAEP